MASQLYIYTKNLSNCIFEICARGVEGGSGGKEYIQLRLSHMLYNRNQHKIIKPPIKKEKNVFRIFYAHYISVKLLRI